MHRNVNSTKSVKSSVSRMRFTTFRAFRQQCWLPWARKEIKTVEDFAGCIADDLIGWTERKDGETKRFEGTLSAFPLSREEAEDMIMTARLKAGWITEDDLPQAEVVEGEGEVPAEGEVAE